MLDPNPDSRFVAEQVVSAGRVPLLLLPPPHPHAASSMLKKTRESETIVQLTLQLEKVGGMSLLLAV